MLSNIQPKIYLILELRKKEQRKLSNIWIYAYYERILKNLKLCMYHRFYFLLPTRSVFDTFAAARQIAPPMLSPPVVVPPPSYGQVRRLPMFHETFSSDNSDREEREGDREDSLSLRHGSGAVRGMMVKKKLKAREAEASYGMPRGGIEEISLFGTLIYLIICVLVMFIPLFIYLYFS